MRPKAEVYHNYCKLSIKATSKLLGVSPATAGRWALSTGVPKQRKKRAPNRESDARKHIQILSDSNPFLTCKEIQARLRHNFGIQVSISTIYRKRKSLGLSFKRSSRTHEHEHPDINHPFMANADPYQDAIAVDETCMVSCDTPRYGWALRGKAVPKPAPRKRLTMSTLLAVDIHGSIARTTKRGAFNKHTFSEFLRSLPSNRTILLDNVAFHRSTLVKATAQEQNQTLVYTPPYCPWFNPVEHVFSNVKSNFRRRRFDYPTEPLVEAIDTTFDSILPSQCLGAFRGATNRRNMALQG